MFYRDFDTVHNKTISGLFKDALRIQSNLKFKPNTNRSNIPVIWKFEQKNRLQDTKNVKF